MKIFIIFILFFGVAFKPSVVRHPKLIHVPIVVKRSDVRVWFPRVEIGIKSFEKCH